MVSLAYPPARTGIRHVQPVRSSHDDHEGHSFTTTVSPPPRISESWPALAYYSTHEPGSSCGLTEPRFPEGSWIRTLSSVVGERLVLLWVTIPESNRSHRLSGECSAVELNRVVMTEGVLSLAAPILLRPKYRTSSPPNPPRFVQDSPGLSRTRRSDTRSFMGTALGRLDLELWNPRPPGRTAHAGDRTLRGIRTHPCGHRLHLVDSRNARPLDRRCRVDIA